MERRDAETHPTETIVEVQALGARAEGGGLALVGVRVPPPGPTLARPPEPIVVQMGAAHMCARKVTC
jgi:hypothetical protein